MTSHRGSRAWRGRARRLLGGALRWCCPITMALATLIALALPGAGTAAASDSRNAVTFAPQSGPVGTQVGVFIQADPPAPTAYLLSTSPVNPATDSCTDSVMLPDAPKIIVVPGQPTTTTISWPSELASGDFYLCASPAAGQKGPTVWSPYSFSVTNGSDFIATATVVASIGIMMGPQGAVPGTTLTLSVNLAQALADEVPASIVLVPVSQVGQIIPLSWALTQRNGDSATFTVTIPRDVPSGTYAVELLAPNNGLSVSTAPFTVIAPRRAPRTSQPRSVGAALPVGALLVAAIALLLALGTASLLVPMLRRRRRAVRST